MGRAARSNEWFAFWEARMERLVAGEAPERIGRIPLEAIDQMRGPARTEERQSLENATD
jgi:hypothetical protein